MRNLEGKGGFGMSKTNNFIRCINYGSLVILLCVVFGSSTIFAEEETIGSEEYRIACLNCHGVGGKGDGPIMGLLTQRPSDLTVLAKNNGGEYPFLRVYQTIDGRVAVPVHGARDMPIWGARYLEEDYERYRIEFGGEDVVRARILQLVYFIQTLQQK